MSSVLNEVITKNVLEATNDDEPPQESINLLMKYCEDSNTKDIGPFYFFISLVYFLYKLKIIIIMVYLLINTLYK